MLQRIPVATSILLVFAQLSVARADEIGELRDLIKKQAEQLQQLQKRLDELEVKQNRQIEAEVAEAVEDKQLASLPDSLKWIERVRISGDLRYRQDH